jgi:hypothetical protein
MSSGSRSQRRIRPVRFPGPLHRGARLLLEPYGIRCTQLFDAGDPSALQHARGVIHDDLNCGNAEDWWATTDVKFRRTFGRLPRNSAHHGAP